MDNEYREIDLKEIFYLIKMKWWIIVICFVTALTAATIYSYLILDPVYRAEALLFVGREPDEKSDPYNMTQIQVNQKLVMDYREIIKSRVAAKGVIDDLGITMNPDTLKSKISVTTVNDSRMFKISFEHTNPQLAADVVNQMSQVIIVKADEIMEVKNVSIVDMAEVPITPIKPNKKMNVAVGGVLGLALGVGIIFVIEFLDNTIKNAKDVERYLGLSIMGEIPVFEGERRDRKDANKRRPKTKTSAQVG